MYRSGRSRWTCLGVLFAWSTTAGALPASAPGARAPVVVSRAEGKPVSGTFGFETDAAATPLVALSVQGQGGGITLESEPRAIDFGAVLVGQTTSRVFTLSNLGEYDVELHSIGFLTGGPEFAPRAREYMGVSIDLPLPLKLKAKSQIDVPVTFSPKESGPLPSLFAFLVGTADGEQVQRVVRFDGRGISPQGQLTSDALDFGLLRAGQTSASRTLTLEHTGSAPLTVSALRLEGEHAEAFVLAPLSLPQTLEPAARLEVGVAFQPPEAQAYTTLLRLESDDPVNPSATVDLRGEGSPFHLLPSARTLDFGAVEVGQLSETRSLTLTNVSDRTHQVRVSPSEAGGAAFFLRDDTLLARPLAPGESITLPLTFRPRTEGPAQQEVQVWVSDQNTPDSTLTVSGTGLSTPATPPPGPPSANEKVGCAAGGALPSGLALGALLLAARRRSHRA